ncbi:unnamed protein product [Larinioides sclopetarius]|uniref:Uncharacterized protein n=1 Tax=Larinioides sclopetarius TaxID=280406 RepID=A0AAV2A6U8_9ARAC
MFRQGTKRWPKIILNCLHIQKIVLEMVEVQKRQYCLPLQLKIVLLFHTLMLLQ